MARCSECGAFVGPTDAFCGGCGVDLDEVAVTVEPSGEPHEESEGSLDPGESLTLFALRYPVQRGYGQLLYGSLAVLLLYAPAFGFARRACLVAAKGEGRPPAYEDWGGLFTEGVGFGALWLGASLLSWLPYLLVVSAFGSAEASPSWAAGPTALFAFGGFLVVPLVLPAILTIYSVTGSLRRALSSDTVYRFVTTRAYVWGLGVSVVVGVVAYFLLFIGASIVIGALPAVAYTLTAYAGLWGAVAYRTDVNLREPVPETDSDRTFPGWGQSALDSLTGTSERTSRNSGAGVEKVRTAADSADTGGDTASNSGTETTSDPETGTPPDGDESAAVTTDAIENLRDQLDLVDDSGHLWEYRGTHDGRLFVLRLLADPTNADAVASGFERITRQWANLDHSSVVRIYDGGTAPQPWLMTEPVGERLSETDLRTPDRIRAVADVCDALRAASNSDGSHLGFRPRDVTFPDGTDGRVAVDDWGLSRAIAEAVDPDSLPTPYDAPEQVAPERFGPAGRHTDIYRLGAVAYFAATGRPPFEGAPDLADAIVDGEFEPPIDVVPDLPTGVSEAITDAMSRAPEDRPDSVVEFQRSLRQGD